PGMVSLLEKHLGNTKLDVRQRGLIVDILGASPSPDAGPALLRTLAADLPLPPDVQDRVLDHLRQHLGKKWGAVRHSALLDRAIDQMLKHEPSRASAVALIAAARKVSRREDVSRIAENAKEPEATRLAAVRALSQIVDAGASSSLLKIIDDTKAPLPLRV